MTEISTEQRDVSLTEMIGLLLLHRRLIVMVVAATTIVAIVIAFLLRPVYMSEVLVSPVEDSQAGGNLGALANQFGGLASLAGIDLGSSAREKDEAIAVLGSRRFTLDFINDNNLMPILFADDWDEENSSWRESDPDQRPSQWDAYKLFDSDIRRISVDRNTGLVTLQIRWDDRSLAQQWANELIQRANDAIREEAIDEANRSIEYLERELENTSVVELRNGVFQLIEQQISAVMLANVRHEYAFKVLDPAVVADEDDYESPRRPLIVIVGLLLGLILGLMAALARHFVIARRGATV